jgi:hypothetical protein
MCVVCSSFSLFLVFEYQFCSSGLDIKVVPLFDNNEIKVQISHMLYMQKHYKYYFQFLFVSILACDHWYIEIHPWKITPTARNCAMETLYSGDYS